MSYLPHQPEVFVIESISPQDDPAERNYVVRTRLRNGNWTRTPMTLVGTYEVRLFLNDKGVSTKRIALAIEGLSLSGSVQVNCQAQVVAA